MRVNKKIIKMLKISLKGIDNTIIIYYNSNKHITMRKSRVLRIDVCICVWVKIKNPLLYSDDF